MNFHQHMPMKILKELSMQLLQLGTKYNFEAKYQIYEMTVPYIFKILLCDKEALM